MAVNDKPIISGPNEYANVENNWFSLSAMAVSDLDATDRLTRNETVSHVLLICCEYALLICSLSRSNTTHLPQFLKSPRVSTGDRLVSDCGHRAQIAALVHPWKVSHFHELHGKDQPPTASTGLASACAWRARAMRAGMWSASNCQHICRVAEYPQPSMPRMPGKVCKG